MLLSSLATERPLRIRLVRTGDAAGLGFAGLFQVLRLAAAELGEDRFRLEVAHPQQLPEGAVDLLLLVADEEVPAEFGPALLAQCHRARLYGVVGAAVDWLVECG